MRIEELHDSQCVESCIVMEHAGSIAEVFAEQTAQRLVEYIVVDHIEDIVVDKIQTFINQKDSKAKT